jgi:D-alanine--poly(phosphoribitol) ligase subunit 2
VEQKLIDYITKEFLTDPSQKITADTKLISSGLVDSFALVNLQIFIEMTFGKKIPAPKITAESFDTIRQMIAIIEKY